jgi:hypothetical protein
VPYGAVVRWDHLFADLEAQYAAAEAAERRAAVGELVRGERATVTLADRVRAAVGRPVRLHVGDLPGERDAVVEGEVVDVGPGWVLLAQPPVRQALVPLAAVEAAPGLSDVVAAPPGVVESRITFGHALRALARDRVQVRVVTASREVVGRFGRVGADHVDVVADAPGGVWTVPLAAIRVVRSG